MNPIRRTSSASRPLPRLDSLPDEVIQAILQRLNARSLVAISSVSRHLQDVANEQLIWKDLLLRDFTFWDDSFEISRKVHDVSFRDWKDLYSLRHIATVATRSNIQRMIDEPTGRLAKAHTILNRGYGIKDALLELNKDASNTDCVLAQRYWSQMVLGCLNRSVALEQWTRVRHRSDTAHPTETALACLDMFILGPNAEGDINDTFRRLDEMVDAVRTAHPELTEQTPRQKAITIAEFLREKKWIGIDEQRDYYSIEHQFLGLALRSPHRNSLPLITCVIYSYVCRAFNLRAQPVSYPMHVHAVIQPPLPSSPNDPHLDLDNRPLPSTPSDETPSDQTHLYIDPFNTSTPTPLSRMRSQLQFTAPNATTAQKTTYLLPATPRALLIRSAHNLVRSVQNTPFLSQAEQPSISVYDAAYAALFALVMFPSSAQGLASSLSDLRQHYAHHFIEDLRNYEMHILPLTTGLGVFGGDRGVTDPLVNIIRGEDSTPKKAKRRSEIRPVALGARAVLDSIGMGGGESGDGDEGVKFTVGTVFRHRRQGYTAVVYGWDGKCEMEERWILGNGVDRLGGGRGQPFYNAFVDDRSTRYVAQENIIPLGPSEFSAEDAERIFPVEIGKWFRRFDADSARFVSNVRDEYPED